MERPIDELLDTVLALDVLADLPRTGWLLRGVRPAESIAEHSFGVALVTALLVDRVRARGETVDGEKALRMALIHDAAEARTGDVPMPSKTPALSRALASLESSIVETLLPDEYVELWRELHDATSVEARIVAAADKIQMMLKVVRYERTRGAHLDEFWANPGNFRTMDLPDAEAAYDRICERAGRTRPR